MLACSIVRPASSVIRVHASNIFSGSTEPIKAKFYMEPKWDRGTKISSSGSGHVTNMAAMLTYGKNHFKSSQEPTR